MHLASLKVTYVKMDTTTGQERRDRLLPSAEGNSLLLCDPDPLLLSFETLVTSRRPNMSFF